VLDGLDAWAAPRTSWQAAVGEGFAELLDAWRRCPQPAVAVTNEVGWGLVSEHRSGRLFADLLGRLNAEVAAASDEVVLMVAGRPLKL
jgi:adenosylcobinamide kinase/adenosylcobinamide-phosphate guanylyltransferase